MYGRWTVLGGGLLTDDVGEQQGQGEGEQGGRQRGALPVAAAVRLVEGEQRAGDAAAGERPRRRRVHGAGGQRVALPRPREQGRRTGALLEQEVPVGEEKAVST